MAVYFNNIAAGHYDGNENSIKATVPFSLDTTISKISIKFKNVVYPSNKEFHLVPNVTITNIDPAKGTWKSVIKISGKHLMITDKILIDNIPSVLKSKTDSTIYAFVPLELNSPISEVKLKVNKFEFTSPTKFSLYEGKIKSINPSTATRGDLLTIYTQYVRTSKAKVKVGDEECLIQSFTDTSVTIKIPKLSVAGSLQITLNDQPFNYSTSFTYWLPKITSISPLNVSFGDTVTITGENLNDIDIVNFGEHVLPYIKSESQTLKIPIVASNVSSGSWNVVLQTGDGINLYGSSLVKISKPVITNISPTTLRNGDIITITGQNFCPYSTIYSNFDIVSQSKTKIELRPNRLNAQKLTLTIHQGNEYFSREDLPITIISPWRILLQKYTQRPSIIGFKNKLYVTSIYQSFNFDPNTKESSAYVSINEKETYNNLGVRSFVYNDHLYVGLGHYPGYFNYYSPVIYRLNEEQQTWESITSVPNLFSNVASFLVNGKLYLINRNEDNTLDKTRIYDFANNTWTETEPFPYKLSNYHARSVVINNSAYVFTFKEAYKFDALTNTWNVLNTPPQVNNTSLVVFNIGNRIYYMVNWYLYEYISGTDKYERRSDGIFYPLRSWYTDYDYYESAASLGSKGYVGLGEETDNLYEYDPDLEP